MIFILSKRPGQFKWALLTGNLILLLLLAVFCFSCSPEVDEATPAGILNEEKMSDVLVSLNISEALLNHNKNAIRSDTAAVKEKKAEVKFNVFKENNVKREDYLKSVEYYSQRPRQLKKIYERVMEKLNLMKQED